MEHGFEKVGSVVDQVWYRCVRTRTFVVWAAGTWRFLLNGEIHETATIADARRAIDARV